MSNQSKFDPTDFAKRSTDFATGSTVFDRFEILGLIASGAQGRVYRAKDILLQNEVALKVLIPGVILQHDLLRFQSEAKLACKMNHKNIATVYDFSFHNDVPFLSMEYIDGESLDSILKRQVALTLDEFYVIFLQVCEALAHAHSQKIVHRDIKPGNITVARSESNEPIVKILDFGIAKNTTPIDIADEAKLTAAGAVIGTPLYMSPEQAQGKTVTTKCDNYSLGCVMWHAMTGSPPFVEESAMQTIMQHIAGELPDMISDRDEEIPEELELMIRKLLSKTPDERPSIAGDVIPLLRELQHDHAMALSASSLVEKTAPEPGTTKPVEKNSNRPLLVVAIVAALFAIIGSFSFKMLKSAELPTVSTKQESQEGLGKAADSLDKSLADQEAQLLQIDDGRTLLVRLAANDEKFRKIVGNRRLNRIDVSDSEKLTDKCLQYFAEVPNLKEVILNRTSVKTLENLDRCLNLEELELKATAVNDQSMQKLVKLPKLRNIRLDYCKGITDSGIKTLLQVKTLSDFGLVGTSVTSLSASALASMPCLRSLYLSDTRVDRAGVLKICSSPSLQELEITNDFMTADFIKKLRADFPLIRFNDMPSGAQEMAAAAQKACDEKRFADALQLYQQLIKLYNDRPYDRRLAAFNMQAGICAGYLKQYPLCQKYLARAVTLSEQTENLSVLVSSLLNRFSFYSTIGQRPKGMVFFERAMKIQTTRRPPSPEGAAGAESLAATYRGMNDLKNAEKWYLKKIELDEKLYGPRSLNSITALVILGEVQRPQMKFDEAEKHYKRGISIIQSDKLTPEQKLAFSEMLGTAYAGLSAIEFYKKNYEGALELSNKAIAAQRNNNGPPANHASVHKQKAGILRILNRKQEADKEEEIARKIVADAKQAAKKK
jgi:serine/threonine protein kinase